MLGGGGLLEYSICVVYTPLTPFLIDNHENPPAFWKNGSFDEHVLQEISGTCVYTNAERHQKSLNCQW